MSTRPADTMGAFACAVVAPLAALTAYWWRARTRPQIPRPIMPVIRSSDRAPSSDVANMVKAVTESPAVTPQPATTSTDVVPEPVAGASIVSAATAKTADVADAAPVVHVDLFALRFDQQTVLWSVGVTTGFVPFYYHCDDIDDTSWGCGYRTVQMLIWQVRTHARMLGEPAQSGVPSIGDIIARLQRLQDEGANVSGFGMGEWLSLDGITLSLGDQGLRDCRILALSNISDIDNIVDGLRDHFVTADLLVICEGSGVIFALAGVRCVMDPSSASGMSYEFFVVDPHGPPQPVDARHHSSWSFHGGIGWVSLRALLFESTYAELALAMPNARLSDAEVLQHTGGWRFLLCSPGHALDQSS